MTDPSKIKPSHTQRAAFVYIRQSTPGQVEHNRELPPVKRVVRNPIAERARPARVSVEECPLRGSLGDLQPLEFVQVRRSPEEALFNSLLEQHHYI